MSDASQPVSLDSPALAWALAYAALGWFVLPLWPRTKKPHGQLVPNGFHDASRDPATLQRWWAACPDAGIGIALKQSGLVAVDIDPRNGGLFTLEQIEAEHGPLVSDVLAFTGGGGEHRVFASSLDGSSLPGKLGKGIDLKADGYIAVEPTVHPDTGKRYLWEGESDPLHGAIPSTLPSWIRDLARAPVAAPAAPAAPARPIDQARLAAARLALPFVECESRDSWLRIGMAIHNELPGPDGFELWCQWSSTSSKFDPQDQLRVWRSFKPRGLSGLGLNTVFAMAQSAGWRNTGNVTAISSAIAPPLPADGIVLDLRQLDARSAATRWAVKALVPEASLGMIFGASGTFKSFIALDYQLHRAWSLHWCGRKTRPGVPVFIAAEGGTGLIRRIKAWHIGRGLDWHQCTMRVVIVPLLLLRQAPALAEAIVSAGVEPADIVVDTLSQTFEGNENAADEIAAYLRALRTHLVERFLCTVTVVHHSGHGATERPRGSSAIQANVDFLLGVFRQGDDSMVSTVECLKLKDGERFKPLDFAMQAHQLGTDEDGEAITSLAASYVDKAAAAKSLLAAADSAAGGHRGALLSLVPELGSINERELRKAFYALNEDMSQDARQRAFVRSMKWAIEAGLLLRSGSEVERAQPVDNYSTEGNS